MLGIVTVSHILTDHIEFIMIDCFIRDDKWNEDRQREKLETETYLTII